MPNEIIIFSYSVFITINQNIQHEEKINFKENFIFFIEIFLLIYLLKTLKMKLTPNHYLFIEKYSSTLNFVFFYIQIQTIYCHFFLSLIFFNLLSKNFLFLNQIELFQNLFQLSFFFSGFFNRFLIYFFHQKKRFYNFFNFFLI